MLTPGSGRIAFFMQKVHATTWGFLKIEHPQGSSGCVRECVIVDSWQVYTGSLRKLVSAHAGCPHRVAKNQNYRGRARDFVEVVSGFTHHRFIAHGISMC